MLSACKELKYAWSCETTGFPVLCELHAVLYMAGQYSSPSLVLGFTAERYVAVCHPFHKQRYCTASVAARAAAGLIAVCLAVASAQVRRLRLGLPDLPYFTGKK